jgi:hypothetical protein
MPTERFLQTRDYTSATLQTTIRFGLHFAIWAERIHFCWANEETIFRLAFCAADFLVYLDVPPLIDLEDVRSEFLFNLQIFSL